MSERDAEMIAARKFGRKLGVLSWSDRRLGTCGLTPPTPVQNERRTPAILNFLPAWRRTFAATRGFVIEKAHADGSTFVSRKATITWLAADPTWTSFARVQFI